ncbi:PIN domain-containing protein [Priestia sp. YIM B13446]|uniref:PIN domain-containing protein n=1 Tax=unclassified Priestia TaxID=2800374 RepID=UPI00366DE830
MIIHNINLQNYIFIADANAFMHDHFCKFLKNDLILAIKKARETTNDQNSSIYVPRTVMEELKDLSKRSGTENLQVRTDALNGLRIAEALITKNYGHLMKSDFIGTVEKFNDVAMLTILMEARRHSSLAILTNDRNFATDILNLNLMKSVKSKYNLKALFIDKKNHKLTDWILDSETREAKRFKWE